VLSAETRAGQYKYHDIDIEDIDVENAAAHLHGLIDARAAHAW
jgi:hypothetical protein